MKKTEKCTLTGSNAGKKRDTMESREKSYSLINKCGVCPLHVYRDLICSDNLNALILQGYPPTEELEQAARHIISECNTLTSGESGIDPKLKEVYLRDSTVMLYSLCIETVSGGYYDEVIEILKGFGLFLKRPENNEERAKIIKRIEQKLTLEKQLLIEAKKGYENHRAKEDKAKLTETDFDDQFIALQVHFKTPTLTLDMMTDQYAGYVRRFLQEMKQLKANQIKRK